jgi:hypothetical protein
MLIKILANYIANEMLEFKRAMKCLIIWRIILNFYFPDEKTIFPSKFTNGTRIEWETNDIDIVLYNAVSREKNEFWSTVDPIDQDNVIAAVTLRSANTNN